MIKFKCVYYIFTKLSYKHSGKLRFHLSYWLVANHIQAFNTRYLYWDEGRNELFRDTYRVNFEINHSLTPRTFYTVRFARFIQDQFQGVRWRDNDKDGFPNWLSGGIRLAIKIFQTLKILLLQLE